MDLTIREAATILGTSERAVRARLARGTLTGHKRAGQWWVPRDALPTDPTTRHRERAKADRIRAAVEAGLARGKQLPLAEVTPFRAGLALLRTLDARLAERPQPDLVAARLELAEGLALLGEGHYHFHAHEKRTALVGARARFARALARLLIAEAPAADRAVLEEEIIPPLGGLIRWAEGLGKVP